MRTCQNLHYEKYVSPLDLAIIANPICIYVPNLVKICQSVRKLWVISHAHRQTDGWKAHGNVSTMRNEASIQILTCMLVWLFDIMNICRCIWLLSACGHQIGWWFFIFRFGSILLPRDLNFEIWTCKSTGFCILYVCQIMWKYVNGFVSFVWYSIRKDKQTDKRINLPKCKFWQIMKMHSERCGFAKIYILTSVFVRLRPN